MQRPPLICIRGAHACACRQQQVQAVGNAWRGTSDMKGRQAPHVLCVDIGTRFDLRRIQLPGCIFRLLRARVCRGCRQLRRYKLTEKLATALPIRIGGILRRAKECGGREHRVQKRLLLRSRASQLLRLIVFCCEI